MSALARNWTATLLLYRVSAPAHRSLPSSPSCASRGAARFRPPLTYWSDLMLYSPPRYASVPPPVTAGPCTKACDPSAPVRPSLEDVRVGDAFFRCKSVRPPYTRCATARTIGKPYAQARILKFIFEYDTTRSTQQKPFCRKGEVRGWICRLRKQGRISAPCTSSGTECQIAAPAPAQAGQPPAPAAACFVGFRTRDALGTQTGTATPVDDIRRVALQRAYLEDELSNQPAHPDVSSGEQGCVAHTKG